MDEASDSSMMEEGQHEVMLVESDEYSTCTEEEQSSSEDESDEFDEFRQALLDLDIVEIKARRSEVWNLQSLQELCIKHVAGKLDYFGTKQEPFNILPGPILEMLTRILDEKASLPACPHLLPLVINEKSQFLSINCTDSALKGACNTPTCEWNEESILAVLRVVAQKCKGQLKELLVRLSFPNHQMSEFHSSIISQLNISLGGLHGLVKLSLRACDITDNTLAVIGSTCKSISELDITHNNYTITDEGIKHLCAGDCRKTLTKLLMYGAKLSADVLLLVLCSMPELTELKHGNAGSGVVKFIEQYPEKVLKLENVVFDYHTENISLLSVSPNVCKVLENIKSIEISGNLGLEPFKKLSKIQELTIDCLSIKFMEVSSMFIHYSKNLTKLSLHNLIVNDFDVSFIGFHCLELQIFEWTTNWNPRINCKYELTQDHFSKLKNLRMISMTLDYSYFPPAVLKRMLASPELQKVYLGCYEIPQEVLEELVEDARLFKRVFSNLKSLSLEDTRTSVSCLKELVCLAPNLISLSITNRRDKNDELYDFVCEHKFWPMTLH